MLFNSTKNIKHLIKRITKRIELYLPPTTHLLDKHLVVYRSFDEFQTSRTRMHNALDARRALEEAVARTHRYEPITFFCQIHGGLAHVPASDEIINWREGFLCQSCQLNARMRLCLSIMQSAAAIHSDIDSYRVYLTEQVTAGFIAARKIFPDTVGSEYIVDIRRRDRLIKYLRKITGDSKATLNYQDVTSLTLASDSFDAIGSFEVIEHVNDYQKALDEFARVLRPGGQLVLTVPFFDQAETSRRARMLDDGKIEHLLPAEYHGDPANSFGALCFHHFGWDLLDALRSSGFRTATVVEAWCPLLGLFNDIKVIVAIR